MRPTAPRSATAISDSETAPRGIPAVPAPARYQSLSDPESLREFARNLREGIYITTREGRILDANPAFLEMFGVSSLAELDGYSAKDLVVDAARRVEQMALIDRDGSL